jgi:hypothetical protein
LTKIHGQYYINVDGDGDLTGTAALFCGHLTSSDQKCNFFSISATTALFDQIYFEGAAACEDDDDDDEEEEEEKENLQLEESHFC